MSKTLNQTLAVLLTAVLMLMFTATVASAHGGGNNANTVDPADASCMGQLASLHANGKNPGNNPDTMPGFGTNQPHPGLGGPYDSIKSQAKAFKAYCDSE